MSSSPRVVLAVVLVVLGVLSCAYGLVILAAIPVSDTSTGSLVVFGLEFVVPGLRAVKLASSLAGWISNSCSQHRKAGE